MKFACMSCAAKYSVPDGRLAAAGPSGLRVRCSRCRAIMVVAADAFRTRAGEPGALGGAPMSARRVGEDEDTKKELRGTGRTRAQMRPSAPSDGVSMGIVAASDSGSDEGAAIAETTSGMMAMPASLSASGVFRAMPGVNRQVTGLFFAETDASAQIHVEGKGSSSRVWYAAVDNRPRGPFSASEMLNLAERGKIRDATLCWRPGFTSWKKVRHGEAASSEDLSWLRKVVLARKLREMDAQERAQDRLGIAPVQLTRTSSGQKRSTWQGGAAGMPPALPDDAVDELPALSLHPLTLNEPRAWRADELPAVGAERSAMVRALGTRRAQRTSVVALAALAAAMVVALASVSLGLVDGDTVDRLSAFVTAPFPSPQ